MKEIVVDQEKLSEVKKALMEIKFSYEPLVLRRGFHVLDEAGWQRFLEHECNFRRDNRHYSSDEEIVLSNWWEISNQEDKSFAFAHSTTFQPFHNDNAWFSDPAQVNFFIMKSQAKSGGEQLIYQSDRLLEDLKREEPDLLKKLLETKVIIKKGDSEYQNQTPVIIVGDKIKVYWNYFRTLKTTDSVEGMCDDFFSFLKLKERSSSVQWVRLESGDCLVMNDQQMLHARNSFQANWPRERVLLQSMWWAP